jgi:SP family general alpha glucoside:H+ symporter-like MFS transporter
MSTAYLNSPLTPCLGPWYLIRKERYAEAETSLRRLARPGYYTDEKMKSLLTLMKHTNEKEKVDAASATYWDCFRGANLRRTEIVCLTFLIQILCGQPICSYATVFLKAAGMDQVQAFNYSMGIQSTNIIATGTAILLMGKFGRRQFYLFGTIGIAIWQLMIGIVGFIPNVPAEAAGIVPAVGMILINLTFKLSLGPACYTIVGETPSSRIRSQSVVLARTSYVLGNLINGQIIPRQLSSAVGGWNWMAKAGIFWFGMDCIGIAYAYFRIPETKDRSFLELDQLFQHKIPARKFKTTQVDCECLVRFLPGQPTGPRPQTISVLKESC